MDALLANIEHLPHGYHWLSNLPRQGHGAVHILRKRWAILLREAFYPAWFLHALLIACVTVDGIPDSRGRLVYDWLVRYVYAGQPARLHQDWAALQEKQGRVAMLKERKL